MLRLAQLFQSRFRFTLWPTLFTIPSLVILIGLGTWQVQRLAWKTALIDERTAALSAPPVDIPPTFWTAKPLDFHHVAAEGTFLNDKELYIGAYSTKDVEGFQVVTPLKLDDGRILLVNRGWVPEARKDPATRAAGEIAGRTPVEGILRIATKPVSYFGALVPIPANRPAENFWFYVDIPAMAQALGLASAEVLPYYIEAGPTPNPGGFPLGGQTRISLPNDHLQYALTWYGFALTLLVIYLVYHYRRPGADDADPAHAPAHAQAQGKGEAA